ncbi:MAG TPA: hypothetical protein VFU21_06255 [Kofleriaceae bacterium]|nr:hypothetical protein [Kofleriaceae bacterium]
MPMQRARLAPPARVLVYSHGVPSVPVLCEALAPRGIDVRSFSDFQELCAWLVCWRGTAVALVEMPPTDAFRDAVTGALHRIDPGLPIAPLDPAQPPDRMLRDVQRLLAADHLPDEADDDLSREAA